MVLSAPQSRALTTVCAVVHLLLVVSASVVILPGGEPRLYNGPPGATSAKDFYWHSAPNDFSHDDGNADILMSALDDSTFETEARVLPSSESFVRGALRAWADHLHFAVRPDEVWFSILSQLFFHVNGAGSDSGNEPAAAPAALFAPRMPGALPMVLTDFEWFRVIQDFKYEAERRCKAAWLMRWAMPNFTTSSVVDDMTATVIMIGQNEAYRAASADDRTPACGLPSVTLQGDRDDWAQILQRLDRFPAFGSQAAAYAAQLAPILGRFVGSFDAPDSIATRRFWNQIVTTTGPDPACPATPVRDTVSGWLTGFFYWDTAGQPLRRLNRTASAPPATLTLDNATYAALRIEELPIAYARAPFVIHNFENDAVYDAYVLAGTLGQQISPGAPVGYADALRRANQTSLLASVNATIHNTLEPLSSWLLYGPANYSAAEQSWVPASELASLALDLRSASNDRQCLAHKAGKRRAWARRGHVGK